MPRKKKPQKSHLYNEGLINKSKEWLINERKRVLETMRVMREEEGSEITYDLYAVYLNQISEYIKIPF